MANKDPLPEKASTETSKRVTKPVDPATAATKAEIKKASGDDGTDSDENTANADVAEQLTEQADGRNVKRDGEPAAFGEGGAAGI